MLTAGCLLYEFLVLPAAAGFRAWWDRLKEIAGNWRHDFRMLAEAVFFVYTNRDLTTPRLKREEEQRREKFYASLPSKR